jgi:hypothetical protein
VFVKRGTATAAAALSLFCFRTDTIGLIFITGCCFGCDPNTGSAKGNGIRKLAFNRRDIGYEQDENRRRLLVVFIC